MRGPGLTEDCPDSSVPTVVVEVFMPGDPRLLPFPTAGGDCAGWKRLDIPETMMPGCRPKNGESRDTEPKILCLKGCCM